MTGYPAGIQPGRASSSDPAKRVLSDDDLLELLREPLQKHGFLTTKIIDASPGVPKRITYIRRFGSMARVYRLLARFPEHPLHRVGPRRRVFAVLSDERLLDKLRQLLKRHGYLSQELIDVDRSMPTSSTYANRFGGIRQAYRLIGYDPKGVGAVVRETQGKP